jgi:hypothetical protein
MWNNGDTTLAINVCDSVTTVHILTVIDSNGCMGVDSVTVTVIPQALINPEPNPNAERIMFISSRAGFGSLRLYDMKGKEVAVLFKDYMDENIPYKVNFSGRDLPAGVYLVRLYSGDINIANSKIVLIR